MTELKIDKWYLFGPLYDGGPYKILWGGRINDIRTKGSGRYNPEWAKVKAYALDDIPALQSALTASEKRVKKLEEEIRMAIEMLKYGEGEKEKREYATKMLEKALKGEKIEEIDSIFWRRVRRKSMAALARRDVSHPRRNKAIIKKDK